MGNICNLCPWRLFKPSSNVIEIIVKDTQDATIKTVQVDTGKFDKIRFILPTIKVTDENNQEFLVYHPEDLKAIEDGIASRTKTIVFSSDVEHERHW